MVLLLKRSYYSNMKRKTLIVEKRIESIETQLVAMSEQIRTLDNEIMRINNRIDEVDNKSVLDEKIEVTNGEKHEVTIRKILVETYSILEPIRLYYRVKDFMLRWKVVKFAFWFMN